MNKLTANDAREITKVNSVLTIYEVYYAISLAASHGKYLVVLDKRISDYTRKELMVNGYTVHNDTYPSGLNYVSISWN